MSVRIHLPSVLEARLRRNINNLEQAAKVSLLIELFRSGEVTHYELAIHLGLERQEVDQLLQRGVAVITSPELPQPHIPAQSDVPGALVVDLAA
jgi:hypothetical protein